MKILAYSHFIIGKSKASRLSLVKSGSKCSMSKSQNCFTNMRKKANKWMLYVTANANAIKLGNFRETACCGEKDFPTEVLI